MALKIARLAAIGALATTLAFGPALAQPTLSPQGGSGNAEMDHSRMGGQGQRQGGQAPTLTPQGGSGNADMDHSRMGGGNMGGPSGGRITGNPGGGPDVEHGPARTPAPAPAQRR
ncbi:hypothetical protein JYK14_08480 [Siccirubricoccus sp. KC 17139]|uniref:Translation initiation factor IF-2 n=1 Tax=Siccirubricoccus soli TaxID=2899147 RepID=A0ABT1D2Q5_9PROT|nr:hypothetical protein [Siccirubricoccus soli]MCO6416203.1 hypothetical protein [Siccirubricoccus soli]MCP2682337.1 hypothetical protein [Siccirubricoccus soli]